MLSFRFFLDLTFKDSTISFYFLIQVFLHSIQKSRNLLVRKQNGIKVDVSVKTWIRMETNQNKSRKNTSFSHELENRWQVINQ